MSTPAEDSPALAPSAPTYDAVPYDVGAFRQSSPDRLAVIGRIFGLSPAPPERCRVLELGCAGGGNLVPVAMMFPQSQFIGIDLSRRQIEDGTEMVRQLALKNIELRHLSIMDVDQALGEFDYIVAHGVYSWVPPPVQEKTLAILRERLTPTGIGYVSYNTFPGWHLRGAIRDILLHHVRGLDDPPAQLRQARDVLRFLATAMPGSGAAIGPMMADEIKLLLATPDSYFMHEYLEDSNLPVWFGEFVSRASAAGLRYVAESDVATMSAARFGPATGAGLRQLCADRISLEQTMDFLRNRMFRQTLLCHAENAVADCPRPDPVREFYVATGLKPESAAVDFSPEKREAFAEPGLPKLVTASPVLKAALLCLRQRGALPLQFEELAQQAGAKLGAALSPAQSGELAEGLLNGFLGGVVELTITPPAFVAKVSDRPVASPYARLRAKAGGGVTNLKLENMSMTEASRVVLMLLDGRHDRNALVTAVAKWLAGQPEGAGGSLRERAKRYVDYILPVFARSALLTA